MARYEGKKLDEIKSIMRDWSFYVQMQFATVASHPTRPCGVSLGGQQEINQSFLGMAAFSILFNSISKDEIYQKWHLQWERLSGLKKPLARPFACSFRPTIR